MMEITFAGAAFAGLLSFLSPCILPIVPFYLSYLAGVGMNQISAQAVIDRRTRLPRSACRLFLCGGCDHHLHGARRGGDYVRTGSARVF